MEINNVLFAFGLTIFAGLATGIGSLMSFFSKKFNPKFLAASLGFSAGVMLYVSMIEIFFKAKDALEGALGPKPGYWATLGAFFSGIAIIALIDKLIPNYENPHEMHFDPKEMIKEDSHHEKKLMRMGLFSALAIAIHNIPEGVAVSAPIYFATKSKKKAFWLSLLSGVSEPVGALIGYFLLRQFFNDVTFGIVFASVAGIMVYISLDKLLPTAEE
jgi:ZIP family zinc transporter